MAYAISAEFKLFVPGVQEASADMPVKWNSGLTGNATVINDRRKASIPDDGTYNLKMAIPSNLGFAPMIDAAFVSKSERNATMIAQAHLDNMKKSFGKWNDALDYAFETVAGVDCKRFKDAVNAKQDNWAVAVADKTLRMTGDKVRGRGVAPIAAFMLVADTRAMGMLRPSDIWLAGHPTNIARDGERPSFKTAVQQALIQTGIAIIASGFDATLILAQNAILESLLNGLEDIAKCDEFDNTPSPDKPHCMWVHDPDTGLFFLHVETGKT